MAVERPDAMVLPATWPAHYPDKQIVDAVLTKLYKNDDMHWGNSQHYLSVGASALLTIESARRLAGATAFQTILDFGSGAGRVTRWLKAAYPQARITASDLRAGDLEFCARNFDAQTWQSGTDIDAMSAPTTYDLIWSGSVLTHLSAEACIKLLDKFVGWTNENGLVVATFHGRFPYEWRRRMKYITEDRLPQIEQGFETTGFGYSDYRGQTGYGVSFCQPEWMVNALRRIPSCQIVMVGERMWDTHQDVLVLKKLA